ncbi:MAG: hypothetical protein CMJ50_09085, partial [Planctomycetaceae bacterium]|nr:hypothetical protein [Planctomycetaceae bacterium]
AAVAENRPYALAFVDMRMPPGWDGLTTIEQLWKADPDLQVVICTAYSDNTWSDIREQLGDTDQLLILKKPFDNVEVCQLALALTEKWHLAQQARLKKRDLERMVDERTEQLREREEALRRKHKLEAIGSLASGIAHEFNNVLQVIRGYTRFAMDELSVDAQPHRDLQYAVEAVDRAAEITRQLLNFSRQQPAKKSHQEVNEIVTMTLRMVRPVFGEQIEVDVDLSDEAGIVYADVDIMSQALLNLCINARDAMPSGGRLRITTDQREILDRRGGNASTGQPNLKPGHYSVITVADTGCGMPAKVIDRVFDPFFTTKEVGKGTGMGLAMVFGTLQNHEGTVTVESSEGQGSTFRIWLPVAAQATNDTQQPTKNSGASSLTGSETILLAEDDPMVRDAAVRVLRAAGYTVIVAADGEDAVRKFEQNADTIQMAVLDVVMPKLDGHRVYDRMKEANSEIKVVFCTAYNPETDQTDVLEGVQVSTIYKPLAEEALLSTMRRMLDEEPLCQTV